MKIFIHATDENGSKCKSKCKYKRGAVSVMSLLSSIARENEINFLAISANCLLISSERSYITYDMLL